MGNMKGNILHIDYETRSLCDLRKHGVVRYAAHASTEVIILLYAFNEEPVNYVLFPKKFSDLPKRIQKHKGIITAFYAPFEHSITKYVLKAPEHFTNYENYMDAQSVANRWGVYGDLAMTAQLLGLQNKLEEGKGLIRKFSIPNRKGYLQEIPEKDLKEFIKYGRRDVKLQRDILNTLPPIEEKELAVYKLDHKIVSRGINIDEPNLKRLIKCYNESLTRFRKQAKKLCGLEKSGNLTITSNIGFTNFLEKKFNILIPNAQSSTLDKLYDKTKDNKLKEIIDLRRTLTSVAPKKLFGFEDYSLNGFLYFYLRYYGAHTGRWTSTGVQIHNIYRKAVAPELFSKTLKILEKGLNVKEFRDTMASMIRGVMIPPKGHLMTVSDLSAIEARITFWFCGCDEALKDYRNNIDLYIKFSNRLGFPHIDPLSSSSSLDAKQKANRQIAKRAILGLGFGMGADKFSDTLKLDGVDDYKLAEKSVKVYRKEYPQIVRTWYALQDCWGEAMDKGASRFKNKYVDIKFYTTDRTMRIILPSGRELSYLDPGVMMSPDGRKQYFYRGRNGVRVRFWGGTLMENMAQAIAADIIREPMLEIDAAGIKILMTEHDSLINAVKIKEVEKRVKQINRIMTTTPVWAKGLLLGVETTVGDRYGK